MKYNRTEFTTKKHGVSCKKDKIFEVFEYNHNYTPEQNLEAFIQVYGLRRSVAKNLKQIITSIVKKNIAITINDINNNLTNNLKANNLLRKKNSL